MRCSAPTALLFLLILLAPAAPAAAAPIALAETIAPALSPGPGYAATGRTVNCEFKWRKTKVVKKIRRGGKVKKVVRFRWRKVCLPVAVPAPARLGVKAIEFGFILSSSTLTAGDTIVELNNRGEDPHDLRIARIDGGPEVVFPETLPSSVSRMRFETAPGLYRLWCSLPFHAERGMDATVEVTAAEAKA